VGRAHVLRRQSLLPSDIKTTRKTARDILLRELVVIAFRVFGDDNRKGKGKRQQQIPFGDENKKGKGNGLSGLGDGLGREADFSAPRCALRSK
jgi:hypothetical protein